MIIRICYFTEKGQELTQRLYRERNDLWWESRNKEESLEDWTKDCFDKRLPILFIGASGIAVRTIAPFVKDKLQDSAVLVMDEKGEFVIPLLSGHMGGANELAKDLANTIGAKPVITTATDVEDIFSVDVFARKNDLHVVNREGIRRVSSKLLSGQEIKIFIEKEILIKDSRYPKGVCVVEDNKAADVIICRSNELECNVIGAECDYTKACTSKTTSDFAEDALILETKEYVIGMGCKKDKSYEEIMTFLQKQGIGEMEHKLCKMASIDLKKDERGLVGAAQYLRIPFETYTADELETVRGDYTDSDFVKQTTGVSNVCERAAMLAAGEGAKLLVKKTAENGITFALARKRPEIVTWET